MSITVVGIFVPFLAVFITTAEGHGGLDAGVDDEQALAVRKLFDEMQQHHKKIRSMKEITTFIDSDYKPFEPPSAKLDENGNKIKKPPRKDIDGGFSRVMFRVWKYRTPGAGRSTQKPVAIKCILPPVYLDAGCFADFGELYHRVGQPAGADEPERYHALWKYVNSLDQALNEYEIGKMLKTQKMYYYGVIYHVRWSDDGTLYLVQKYLNGKDAFESIFPPDPSRALIMTPDEALRNAARIGEMLYKLHLLGIIYRDLKPENMIIDKQLLIYLIDMGLALILKYTKDGFGTDYAGTDVTMALEVHRNLPYGYRADVWSFGICVYIFFTGNLYVSGPFGNHQTYPTDEHPNENSDIVLHRLQTETPNYDDHPVFHSPMGKLVREFLEFVLVKDYKKRPTMKQALQHELFRSQGYRFDHLSFGAPIDPNVPDRAAPPVEKAEDVNRLFDDPYDGEQDKYIEAKKHRQRQSFMFSSGGHLLNFDNGNANRRRDSHLRVDNLPYRRSPTFTGSEPPHKYGVIRNDDILPPISSGMSRRGSFSALIMLQDCIKDKKKLPTEFEIRDPHTGQMEKFVKVAPKGAGTKNQRTNVQPLPSEAQEERPAKKKTGTTKQVHYKGA